MKTKVFLLIFAVMTNVGIIRSAIVNGTCGDNLTWSLNTKDSTLTIEGYGVLTSKPWDEYNRYIATVIFPEGIINNTVNKVFANCTNLHNIVWNSSNYLNDNMYSYKAHDYAGSYYAYHPFYEIRGQITSVTFGENVQYIPNRLCYEMINLKSVTSKAVAPPTTGTNVFYNIPFSSIALYCPYESMTTYSNSLWWEEFTPINPLGYYLIVFVDWDGTILSSNYVEEGQSAIAPELQPRFGYIFIGWDKKFNNVISDMTITALYVPDNIFNYTINFIGKNDENLESNVVVIKVPTAPIIEGFTFIGWRPVASIIENNTIEIEAVYEADEPSATSEIVVDSSNSSQKLIRNGNTYILRGNKTYTITGAEVK